MRVALFVVLVSLFFYSCQKVVSEKEPENNFLAGAATLTDEKPAVGTFYSQENPDVDFFFVPVEYPTMIQGKLSAVKGVDSYIELYRQGEGEPFKTINDGQSSLPETFGPIQIKAPGVWIAVRSLHQHAQVEYKKLKYTFSISLFTPPSFMEQEANDSPAFAELISPESNGTILGYYNNVFSSENEIEKDFFIYRIDDAGKMLVDLELTGVSNIDTILRVYNEDGVILATADKEGLSKGESIRSLGVEAPTKLIISVNAKDFLTNYSEYYQLKVTHRTYENRFEYEPNDTIETASLITEEKTFAQINDSQDKDFFQVRNNLNDEVFVHVSVIPSANLDVKLTVFYKDPVVINDATIEKPEGISNFYLAKNKNLFFSVESVSGMGNYSIVTRFIPVTDNFEQEPNNDVANANVIGFDREMAGYINPNADVDYFRIRSLQAQSARLLVQGLEGCVLQVSLGDREGTIIDQYRSKKGQGISKPVDIQARGIIKIECLEADKNLLETPYTFELFRGE